MPITARKISLDMLRHKNKKGCKKPHVPSNKALVSREHCKRPVPRKRVQTVCIAICMAAKPLFLVKGPDVSKTGFVSPEFIFQETNGPGRSAPPFLLLLVTSISTYRYITCVSTVFKKLFQLLPYIYQGLTSSVRAGLREYSQNFVEKRNDGEAKNRE